MDITKIDFNSNTTAICLNSNNINVFPCGRRRAQVDADNFMPYDPEARLNTEANNRKHTSLNGFANSFIKGWNADTKTFSFVIEGYLFDIKLDVENAVVSTLSDLLSEALQNATKQTNIEAVYANILIKNITLFSDNEVGSYFTEVLCSQDATDATFLDRWNAQDDTAYFTGLSFSCTSLQNTLSSEYNTENGMRMVSLLVFQNNGNGLEVYQPSLLPNIQHGQTKDSVDITTLDVQNLNVTKNVTLNNIPVMSLSVEATTDDKYQLVFSSNTETNTNDGTN